MDSDQDRRAVAAQSLCEALEAEFLLLHGPLPDSVAAAGNDLHRRADALADRIDALQGDDLRTALCLSGGGIRSATYCLGALQGLAKSGMLGRFHYLSTVSGGGYIGSWLSSWIARPNSSLARVIAALRGDPELPPERRPVVPMQAAGRAELKAQVQGPIDSLRAYTNYLSPVWGLSVDFLTLIATFMRNLALHWTILLPSLFALVLMPRFVATVHHGPVPDTTWIHVQSGVAALLIAVAIGYIGSDLPGRIRRLKRSATDPAGPRRLDMPKSRFASLCMAPLTLASMLLSWSISWSARQAPVGCHLVDPGSLHDLLSMMGADDARCRVLFQPGWMLLLSAASGALLNVVAANVGWACRFARGLQPERYTFPWIAHATAIATGGLGGAGVFLYTRFVFMHPPLTDAGRDLATILAVPTLLMIFWAAVACHVGMSRRWTTEEDREWWARASAASLGVTLGWVLLFSIVLCVPRWVEHIATDPEAKSALGFGTVGVGALTSAIGFWSKRGATIKAEAETWAARLGLRMLDLVAMSFVVLLLAIFSVATAHAWHAWEHDLGVMSTWIVKQFAQLFGHEGAGMRLPAIELLVVVLVLGAFGWLASRAVGVNTFSLHGMYGNRLVRAYLGATHARRVPHWFTGFDPEDNMPLADLAPKDGRLFHVINATLNLAKAAGDRLEWQQRKAASFTFTPQHCGSAELGYVSTQDYGCPPATGGKRQTAEGERTPGVTVGRAMAISGAAASPNMGYHTSVFVAFAMNFFNVRLGWWLPNPRPAWRAIWSRDEPTDCFARVLAEATATTSDASGYVYLSDGGHFENLGLYEMVRRRCRRIVMIDASEDADFMYEDLEDSLRKIRIDLGAEVTFDSGLPTRESVRRTGCAFAIGQVQYDKPDVRGTIVYVKPALTGCEPLDVAAYAARANQRKGPTFPHDSTARQDFDEAQFESYRMLGMQTVKGIFSKKDPTGWFDGSYRAPDHRAPATSST